MEKTKIYVAFAATDQKYRDRLLDQLKNPFSMFQVVDTSTPGSADVNWKLGCEARLRQADLLIVLIGSDTAQDDGVAWEIASARGVGIPSFGIYVDKENKAPVPPGLAENLAIEWTWDGISNLIKALIQK